MFIVKNNMQNESKSQKSDLIAVALSFLAGIVQLFLFFIGILGQVTGMQKIFIDYDFFPFAILLSMIISLCIVGVISFIKKTPEYINTEITFKPFIFLKNLLFEKSTQIYYMSKKTEKRNLVMALFFLILFAFVFVLSTLSHLTKQNFFFINSENRSVFQLISFMSLWIITPVILFVWISNEIEKNNQFKPDNFIPNLIRSLQSQGFIQIIINNDVIYKNVFHLVSAKIQEENKYFMVQYDGKKIVQELTLDEFKDLISKQLNNGQL